MNAETLSSSQTSGKGRKKVNVDDEEKESGGVTGTYCKPLSVQSESVRCRVSKG